MIDRTDRTDEINTELNCEIVRDLLPLYHDKVVSGVTESAVSRHLKGCAECSAEYETLCAELPQDSSEAEKKGIKERFSAMMKKVKHKGLIKGIVIAAAAVAVLGGAWYFLTEVPIVEVPAEDIEVARVYRYDYGDKTGEKGFFVYYKVPVKYFSGPQHGDVNFSEDGDLEISFKTPIITYNRTDDDETKKYEEIWTIPDPHNAVTVSMNGKEIWNAKENGGEDVPGYVEAYHDFEWECEDGSGWSADNDTFTAYYGDGTMKTWDIDGNVINEGKIRTDE